MNKNQDHDSKTGYREMQNDTCSQDDQKKQQQQAGEKVDNKPSVQQGGAK